MAWEKWIIKRITKSSSINFINLGINNTCSAIDKISGYFNSSLKSRWIVVIVWEGERIVFVNEKNGNSKGERGNRKIAYSNGNIRISNINSWIYSLTNSPLSWSIRDNF